MKSEKETLRRDFRDMRRAIKQKAQDGKKATALFQQHINPDKDLTIAGYWPVGGEFDCATLLKTLDKEGHRCALPSVEEGTRILSFVSWTADTELKKRSFGIYEPRHTTLVVPDILVMPLLAFDMRGYRLGQGGGYYDATLEHLRARRKVLAVGVAYEEQKCLSGVPHDDHDEKLDWVITPENAYRFK